jgi:microcompartment protein CcmL/EutN
MEPAIGLIELKSVARGIVVTDVVAKKAPVNILKTHPICPGKYVVLFSGEVGPVVESLEAGKAAARDLLVNDLLLPQVHESVVPAISGINKVEEFGSIGIVETFSVASCVVAADIAAKAADISLVEVRLAMGLGGKAYFVMTGELYSVEASFAAATEFVKKEGLLAGAEVIAAPHADVISKGVYW